jgi:hypothetical protein
LTEGLKEGEETSEEVSVVAVAVEMRQVVLRVHAKTKLWFVD